ncbi:MAG: hypothetical protein ACRC4N_04615, partial [Gammaproteobacteria bacterium]
VSLIWQPEPGFNESTFIDPRGNGELRLWTAFIFNRTVTFTCSAATGRQSESSNLSVNCTGMLTRLIKGLQSQTCQVREAVVVAGNMLYLN